MIKQDQGKEILESMLHPVRMRIMLALSGSQGMTPLQIAEQLNDVPQATLYRQIARLAKAGLLTVVEERPVRGTTEKVYALNTTLATHLGPEAVAHLSKEDHLRYFTAFTVTLMDEFTRYLNRTPRIDYVADGVGYGQIVLYMSDAELANFGRAFNEAVKPYLERGDAPDRKKRIFSTVMVPDVSGKEIK